MNRLFIILALFWNVTLSMCSQFYIGYHKDQIIDLMAEKHENYSINTDFINRTYKYLKFEDKIDEQTILFFLDESNYCSYIRWISDYSNINTVTADLNKNYSRINKHTWTYKKSGCYYLIKLKEEEWYFTITVQKK